jgi:hypothetical protein
MGRDNWNRTPNRNFLGDIHEEIEAGTAADKAYEQLGTVTGLKVCFRTHCA